MRTTGEVRIGSIGLSKTVDHWINDGLMAIIVIAIFYTADLSVTALALGGLGVAALPVLNLLAFANAGVSLHGLSFSDLAAPIPIGIISGLFIGKQIGVFTASLLAIRLRLAAMPEDTTTAKLYAMAILTGIGFTMSLFIGTLAFDDETVLKQVRLGVLAASLLSGIVAAAMFSLVAKSDEASASR